MHRPSIVEEDGVARLDAVLGEALLRQRTAHIGHRHFITAVECRDALVAGNIDQDAARDDRLDVLDTERLEAALAAVASCQILLRESVVVHVLQCPVGHPHHTPLMTERVVLRTHLADIAGEVFLLCEPLALFLRCRRHMGNQIERAVSILRHLRFVDVSELVGLPRFGDAQRLEYLLGRDVVRVARLILGAVRRGPPWAFLSRLGDQQTAGHKPDGQNEECRATPDAPCSEHGSSNRKCRLRPANGGSRATYVRGRSIF